MLHVILGAGGTIGRELAAVLPTHGVRVRLARRTTRPSPVGHETIAADLLDPLQTRRAVEGASVAYLTAGLRYRARTWEQQWPSVMRNVLDACKAAGAGLVFFDNVYAYGPVEGWMTEETPERPSSRKGAVRAALARMLMEEVRAGALRATIARSADFYGPDTPLSFAQVMIFDRLARGKRAQWMVNAAARHSFTFTPDAGNATALLGISDKGWGRVWHLPTAREPLAGADFVALAARALDADPRVQVLSHTALRFAGLFIGAVRESSELLYQVERDYLFDSSAFEKTFGMAPTGYDAGIRATAEAIRARR